MSQLEDIQFIIPVRRRCVHIDYLCSSVELFLFLLWTPSLKFDCLVFAFQCRVLMSGSCLQASAVEGFLQVLRHYCAETLCKDLRSHTITNVQSNNDKVNSLFRWGSCSLHAIWLRILCTVLLNFCSSWATARLSKCLLFKYSALKPFGAFGSSVLKTRTLCLRSLLNFISLDVDRCHCCSRIASLIRFLHVSKLLLRYFELDSAN